MMANFFQIISACISDSKKIGYFALSRRRHSPRAIARIRDNATVFVDVFRESGRIIIHPAKMVHRYVPGLFERHDITSALLDSKEHAEKTEALPETRSVSYEETRKSPWHLVYERLSFLSTQSDGDDETKHEINSLKKRLCRMMLGVHPSIVRLVERYFTFEDLRNVRERVIGSGRIGGKAAGMLIARRILLHSKNDERFSDILETHDSFYLGSDVFFTFLVNNNIYRLRLALSGKTELKREDYSDLENRFQIGHFPPHIVEQFRKMLRYYGQAPIIVRSSSLLEDSFGNAFAGKYLSEFCTNQGSEDTRLEAFMRAVKKVYASALNPDALAYRRRRKLGESDEQMAILVQRVSGVPYRNYFFPSLAGVAFSHNQYAWNDRIDPTQGMVRMVFGLGTRAVDRVGEDYPRMIAISHPQLRPEMGARAAKYSQRFVDVLDLDKNCFVQISAESLLEPLDYPNLHLFVSEFKDGNLNDPFSRLINTPSDKLVLTFGNLIKQTRIIPVIGEILNILENAYGHPVDTEFTASLRFSGQLSINLLQCRPLWAPGSRGPISLPKNIPADRILFRSNRVVSGGIVKKTRYILLIDPDWYDKIPTLHEKQLLGRVVGKINRMEHVVSGGIIMIGPGRWGTSNIDLGINVTYADISNTSVLVEMAREGGGEVPEVSYGTHFFQDLVESQIIYLPLYPDNPACAYNHGFFSSAGNALESLLPEHRALSPYLHLIDINQLFAGYYVKVVADPQKQTALCYLE